MSDQDFEEDERAQNLATNWPLLAIIAILIVLGLVVAEMSAAVEAANLSNVTEIRG